MPALSAPKCKSSTKLLRINRLDPVKVKFSILVRVQAQGRGEEYLAGETLRDLAERHDISRNVLIVS